MDLALFLMIFLTGAALNIHRGIVSSSQVHGQHVAETVNVTCGHFFQLRCILNSSDECTWNRQGTFVKPENKRYSFANETLGSGSTLCMFTCSKAEIIDGGQWTCGTPGNDNRNGIISKYFSINVHAEYGTNCNPVTTTANSVEYPDAPIPGYDTPQITNGTWIIIVGTLCSVVLILIAIVIIWICLRRNRHKPFTRVKPGDTKETSIHEYEDIDANGGYLPPLPRERPAPNLNTIPAQTLPTCGHFHDGPFEIPISDRNSSLNPPDSDFIFKLIAIRKPKDENSIDLENSIELASFKNQLTQGSTHPYQNIRQDIGQKYN